MAGAILLVPLSAFMPWTRITLPSYLPRCCHLVTLCCITCPMLSCFFCLSSFLREHPLCWNSRSMLNICLDLSQYFTVNAVHLNFENWFLANSRYLTQNSQHSNNGCLDNQSVKAHTSQATQHSNYQGNHSDSIKHSLTQSLTLRIRHSPFEA
jgi:hypothetical protein